MYMYKKPALLDESNKTKPKNPLFFWSIWSFVFHAICDLTFVYEKKRLV